ncbi:ADP-ribosylation factor-like protein 16 [Bombus vosnesenskii]|uniref:ADP-ribosylation factor-like protein 16 n=2 Tax=Pyrobombus TaxID=144703 RepID=A0A6J3K5X8_9HYME|nr:ADP-ribosylation factor-like protein 16 [Bombus vancouverensis nearcticus]XP_033314277.1 ADP-ribosylation factor-like protein 16 [Bombus bifarius]XP_033347891.1 ADP-ribosylation factor-like protein 16 [Bombus vosnesenskii]
MCLCLGPVKSGKTFLMKRLQGDEIDNATHTVSTNGINLFTIKNSTGEFDMIIKEIGGSMAPIWKHYFEKTRKLIYVIDTSNLCQISAAGVLLYSLLLDPRLRNIKIALTLNKMDLSYRQMRNEALLILHYSRLQKEATQELSIFETSGMTGQGIEELRNWLFDPITLKSAINASNN